MKRLKIAMLGSILGLPVSLLAGNPYFLTFSVLPEATLGLVGLNAVQDSGLVVVRYGIPGQAAYQEGGPDGPGLGRIFTRAGTSSYVLTDIGSQWTSGIALNQTVLAVLECYTPQFGWDGPAFSAAQSEIVTKNSISNDNLIMNSLTLTALPVPTLFSANTSTVQVSIPAYQDAGGQADGLVLWRQDSTGTWQDLTTLPVTAGVLTYLDSSVAANASYYYGISVSYAWPGGGQAGALPRCQTIMCPWLGPTPP